MTSRQRRDWRNGLLFVSPWIVGFGVFMAYPIGASLYYSFCEYSILQEGPPRWVGVANYAELLGDPVFHQALVNTAVFAVVSVPLSLLTALVMALVLAPDRTGAGVYRTVFYLPVLIPQVAVAAVGLWVFNNRLGVVNRILGWLYGLVGIRAEPPTWISPDWIMTTLVVLSLWAMGTAMVIFIAGLRDVPVELYEAAQIDGAGPVRQAWHVSVPMIAPLVLFNLVVGLIHAVNTFAIPVFMTTGVTDYNLGHAITFYAPLLKAEAMDHSRMGYASSMAWVLLVLVLALTAVLVRLLFRRAYAAYQTGGS